MIYTRLDYHGWQIELILEMQGYSFQCWRVDGREGISDCLVYATSEQALAALSQSILEYARLGGVS